MILEKVQALGDLHTARYSFSRVFEHETQLEPAQWLASVPLAENVVHSATSNRALVTVTGNVEAGIDMRKAKVSHEGEKWLVILPQPQIYAPHADGSVYSQKSSIFWSDPNIGLKAEHLAGAQFAEGARRAGIIQVAKDEAAKRVRELLSGATKEPIQVQFEG